MPSKKSLEIITLKKQINILNKKIDNQIPLQAIKNITIQEKKDQPYGLIDLIAGKAPTLSGWTNNPTDGSDITDNNPATFCTTGNKIAGAGYQYGIFEWDLNDFYNVIFTGFAQSTVSAGARTIYVHFWDGSNWIATAASLNPGGAKPLPVYGCKCSKVRLCLGSSIAATITPNVREFHVWRLE